MIKHVTGDIFKSGVDVILHQVNCQGAMNSGVARQVREKYPEVYDEYKRLCNTVYKNPCILLGVAQAIKTNDGTTIVNLFAQEAYGYDGKQYTSYEALRRAFNKVRDCYKDKSIAIPYRIGCCRGGGDWNVVYAMILSIFDGCDVTLYEYNGG